MSVLAYSIALMGAVGMGLTLPSASFAACTVDATAAGLCSGVTTTPVIITNPNQVAVRADDTFTITTPAGNRAIDLEINSSAATGDMTFTQAPGGGAISGGTDGIYTRSESKGTTNIQVTGTVTGITGNGIDARQGVLADGVTGNGQGTGLFLRAATVTGGQNGILVDNQGDGFTHITTTGIVTGNAGDGIRVNSVDGQAIDLIIHANEVRGGQNGVNAYFQGLGRAEVVATGAVTGTTADGILVNSNGNGLVIQATAVTGGINGITANNYAASGTTTTSGTTISTSGPVIGNGGDGIQVNHYGSNVVVTTQAAVTGAQNGIKVLNDGVGTTNIVASGAVTGRSGAGILAENIKDPIRTSAGLTVQAINVTGATDGIATSHAGTGSTAITSTGTITGTAGAGIRTKVLDNNGSAAITVASGSVVQGGLAGVQLETDPAAGASNLTASINNAGTIRNLSALPSGLAIRTGAPFSSTINNQGVIIGTVNLAPNAAGNQLNNAAGATWNTAGGINWFSGTQVAGGTGTITNQGTIIAAAPGASGAVRTTFNGISANSFNNSGTITTQNGITGDIVTINGGYSGANGRLLVDSTWNDPDTQRNDLLVINGPASGNTAVSVPNNIIGDVTVGSSPKNGGWAAPVVTVNGIDPGTASTPSFTGTADTTNAGQAQLVRQGNSYYWTLNAVPDPGPNPPPTPVPVPDGPAILIPGTSGYVQMSRVNREMGFDQMGKLHERVGEQQTWAWDDCGTMCSDYAKLSQAGNPPRPIWGRVGIGEIQEQGQDRFGYKSTSGFLQLGTDLNVKTDEERNHRHIGVMLTYSRGEHDFYDKYRAQNGVVTDDKHVGTGTTDMYSLGAYTTWYRSNGAYVDLVGNVSGIRNKYKSASGDPSQNGYGLGASVEAGRPWQLGDSHWQIEPQAQLSYQYVNLSDFDDNLRTIDGQNGGTLRGRVGARLAWNNDDGRQRTRTFYITANLLHDLTGNKSEADIGRDNLTEHYARTWGELGVGGQVALSKSTYLFGDVRYERSLSSNNNEVYRSSDTAREGYSGRIGMRYIW